MQQKRLMLLCSTKFAKGKKVFLPYGVTMEDLLSANLTEKDLL